MIDALLPVLAVHCAVGVPVALVVLRRHRGLLTEFFADHRVEHRFLMDAVVASYFLVLVLAWFWFGGKELGYALGDRREEGK